MIYLAAGLSLDTLANNSDCNCSALVTQEWIDAKVSGDDKGGYDQYLTIETLEKMINTLERLTGFGDTVTLVCVVVLFWAPCFVIVLLFRW